jgi:hypothetical protein
MSYTTLVMFGGYGGLFAVWQFTKDTLSRNQTLLSAFLMLSSIIAFILFEIYKTFHQSNDLILYQQHVLKPENQCSLNKLQEAEKEYRSTVSKRAQSAAKVWKVVFPLTVITGLAAGFILLFSFIRGLLV